MRNALRRLCLLVSLMVIFVGMSVTLVNASVFKIEFSGKTSSYWTNVRSGSGTGYSVVKTIAPNTWVSFEGYEDNGTAVQDLWTGGWDKRWFIIKGSNPRQYVASAVIYGNPPSTGTPENTTPAPSNNKYDKAVNWANQQVGKSGWYTPKGYWQTSLYWCAKFVANAYGSEYAGGNANQLRNGIKYESWTKAPKGALLHYKEGIINGGYGHIGIYDGAGSIIHGGYSKVRKDNPNLSGQVYLGWSNPPSSWPGK